MQSIIEPEGTSVVPGARSSNDGGRELQTGGSGSCNFYFDLARKNYPCTLPEYCQGLAETDNNTLDYTCEGDLKGDFSISYQGYVCFDPDTTKTTWIQADDKLVCYNNFDRTDFSKYFALQRTAQYDFVEGFSFNYTAKAILCADGDGAKQCSCIATIEGQQCNTCTVCNDGLPIVEANAYVYDIDCNNIAEGMTRSCDASFTWGDFFQRVEDIGFVPFVSPSQSPTGQMVPPTVPNPTTNRGVVTPTNSNDKGLSSAATGGIVGAAVGVGLAVLLGIVLVVVLRRWKNHGGKDNDDSVIRGAEPPAQQEESSNPNDRTSATAPSGIPMAAEVILLDESCSVPTTKPSFKAQMRPY